MRLSVLFLLLFVTKGIFAQKAYEISGQVLNFTNREPIANASVSIKKLIKRYVNGDFINDRIDFVNTIADSAGNFKKTIPAGEYVIEASALGFTKKSKFINVKSNVTISLELSEQANQLDDLEVKARKAEANLRDVQSGVVKLNIQGIKKLPVVFGEGDIIKALTLQPGVTTVGEGAGGFNVRGGRVDQNLVLLDDAPLYNTSHLLGFFTAINTEAIQSATLYKAGIPSNFGGRLSSLFNINTKAQTDTPKKSLGLGIISSNGTLLQPFAKGKGTFMLAARGAYPNWIIKQFPKRYKDSRASFYDINAAIQYRILPKHNLKLSAYRSGDNFKFPEDSSYFWKTQTGTAHWSGIINSKASFNVKALFSDYTFGVNGLKPVYEFKLSSRILHKEIKTDFFYQLDKLKIDVGAGVIYYDFQPGKQIPKNAESIVTPRVLDNEKAREASAFVGFEYNVSKQFSFQAGARYVYYDVLGPSKTFLYKEGIPLSKESISDTSFFNGGKTGINYGGIEPRLSLKYELSKSSSLKLNYHRMRQYVHLISNTTAISPVDYWKLSNAYIPPQMADQYALGLYKNYNENKIQTYIEFFYKDYKNLVEYKDGADLLLNPHLETELLNAQGLAYGAEFNIQKIQGRFTGNLSYTYSRSLIKANAKFKEEAINDGKLYPSLFDKPHNLSLLSEYYLGTGWSLAGTFTYQTGRPVTYPDAQYYFGQTNVFNYGNRNQSRLPDFHRLDFSLSKDSRRNKDQKKYSIVNFSIYNLYARRNPYSVFFRQYIDTSRSYRLAVLGTIVPSITLTKYW